MFSWCTKEEWHDEELDLRWVIIERGMFPTSEEAHADATKHGYGDNCCIIGLEG